MWAAGVRRRLSRVTEVKERIGATVLGEIPRVAMTGLRPTDLFVKHSEPMAMEAFQELRSNLLISLPAGASAMIAVTSCDPGEGKTSVSTNIAWALAAQDRHVTAIDCDLRKPALHTQMGVPFGPGVTSRRTEDALAHASRTPNPYLDVIPAGIIDRHPSDIVSAHLPLLIEQLRERHETAVIDCPPLIGVAETVLIATMVDLVIVVVDARRFNPERLQQCLLRLDTANTNVAIVLNRVRFNRKRRDLRIRALPARRSHASSCGPSRVCTQRSAVACATGRTGLQWSSGCGRTLGFPSGIGADGAAVDCERDAVGERRDARRTPARRESGSDRILAALSRGITPALYLGCDVEERVLSRPATPVPRRRIGPELGAASTSGVL